MLTHPLTVALHALERSHLGGSEVVALFGMRRMSRMFLAIWDLVLGEEEREPVPRHSVVIDDDARSLSTAVSVLPTYRVNASREEPVRALLQMTGGAGVDSAIETTGNPTSIAQALASVKLGGLLLQVGIPTGRVPVPLGEMIRAEKELRTSNDQIRLMDVLHALDLLTFTPLPDQIGYQLIDLATLVERRLSPLAEYQDSSGLLVRMS